MHFKIILIFIFIVISIFNILKNPDRWHHILSLVATDQKNNTPFQVHNSYSYLPIYFEPNLGQTSDQVKFLARGLSYSLFLTQNEAVLTLNPVGDCHSLPCPTEFGSVKARISETLLQKVVVHIRFEGANHNPSPKLEGLERLPGISNYFIGNNPEKWHTHIPHFQQVRYQDIYPGIDLVFYGNAQKLEYDFILAPGANPDMIQTSFDGVEELYIRHYQKLKEPNKNKHLSY